jgi:hypothetical protein
MPTSLLVFLCTCLLSQFFQLRKQLRVVGQNAGFVLFDPAQFAGRIDDEDRSLRSAHFDVKDAVLLRHLAVGPEIREERERNPAQRFPPGAVGKNWIAADSQDLAIESIELSALRFVGWNLFLSGRGERERVEGNDDILPSDVIVQSNVNARDIGFCDYGGQSEIRGAVTDFQLGCNGHGCSPEKFGL